MGLDDSSESRSRMSQIIMRAKTIVRNWPVAVLEVKKISLETKAVMDAVVDGT